jgi:ATP-binding protein involved in chromosome partitioning
MTRMTDDEFRAAIEGALSKIIDPDLGRDIVSLGFIKNIIVKKQLLGSRDVSFEIELTTPACPVKDQFQKDAQRYVSEIPGVGRVDVKMTAQVRDPRGKSGIPGIRNILAVGSGKGGVGKSTLAVNLAYALKQQGARVALLDADIYGPSLAQMLGLSQSPKVKDGKILPAEAFGIPVMSFAFFAPVGEAVIWRGPQIGKAVQQMLRDVDWLETPSNPDRKDIDYLVIDLPPGTGDVHLTIAHTAPITGAILVSTPQDISLIDTLRGLYMFEKLKIPVLGLVENMSGFVCPKCGTVTDIFGSGGAEKKAIEKGLSFLGRIPLHPLVVTKGDRGVPLVVAEPEHFISKLFLEISSRSAQELSKVTHKEGTSR